MFQDRSLDWDDVISLAWDDSRSLALDDAWVVSDVIDLVLQISGHLDLSNFDLSCMPLEAVYIDRPLKWTRFGVDRYIRIFTEDLNQRCEMTDHLKTLNPGQRHFESSTYELFSI